MSLMNIKNNIPVSHQKDNRFSTFHSEVDNFIRNFYDFFEPFNFPARYFEDLSLYPAIDIVDDEKEFKIEAEMPGMDAENINVFIENGFLKIKGEKTMSKKDKDRHYRMREINYGRYERSLFLPDFVDVDEAKASFKKGVLWINIPKKTGFERKCRTIDVEKT